MEGVRIVGGDVRPVKSVDISFPFHHEFSLLPLDATRAYIPRNIAEPEIALFRVWIDTARAGTSITQFQIVKLYAYRISVLRSLWHSDFDQMRPDPAEIASGF